MKKVDRELFDTLLARLGKEDHYRRMSIEHCLSYGLTTKRAELAKLREYFGV